MRWLGFFVAVLFLMGCAEKTHPVSRFITVDIIECKPISKSFYSKQLKKIDKYYLSLDTCGVVFEKFRIIKGSVLALLPKYSVLLDKAEDLDNPMAPLKITQFNKEHCLIYSGNNVTWEVDRTCNDIEWELMK